MDCHRHGFRGWRRHLIVYGTPVGQWVARRTSGHYSPETSTAIGMARNGEIVAGCIFEDGNGASFVCHLAADGRFSREFLWVLADYAFRQCKVNKLIAPVYSTNTRMIRMATKMGFRFEHMITDAAPGGDIYLFTMTPQQCRFSGERYGKKSTSTSIA